MGVVYRASDDKHPERSVAVKFLWPRDPDSVLRESRESTSEERHRFERECEMHQRFGGQGVPAFVYACLARYRPYLVTEWVDGSDLHAFLTRNRPTLSATACVIVSLLEILSRVHGEGVVHRDIKPANVLLARHSGVLYLTDFGIALPTDPAATRYTNGRTPGTIGYMAPEIHRGERNPGPEADIYGVACIAFQMVTGRLVFEAAGNSDYDLARLHCEEQPPLLSDFVPGLPPEIVDITNRMLAKSPSNRPPLEIALSIWRRLLPVPGDPAPRPALDPDVTLPYRVPEASATPSAAAPARMRRPQVNRRPVGGLSRSALRNLCADAQLEVEHGEPDKSVDELALMLARAQRTLPAAIREIHVGRLVVARAQILRGETTAAGRTYRAVERQLAGAPVGTEDADLRLQAQLGAVQAMLAEGSTVQATADAWLQLAEELISWPAPGYSGQALEMCQETGSYVEELVAGTEEGEVFPGTADAIRTLFVRLASGA